MSIELSIDNVFDKFQEDVIKLSNKQLPLITRQALNRTVPAVRTEARRLIQNERNLKLKTINKLRAMKMKKAKGSSISKMNTSIEFSGESISLIHFLNNPSPQRQAYIPVKKRKRLRIKVGKKRVTFKNAVFIQRGKKNKNGEGNLHVYQRWGGRTTWTSRNTSSLASLVTSKNMERKLYGKAEEVFDKQFKTRLDYELSKMGKSKR